MSRLKLRLIDEINSPCGNFPLWGHAESLHAKPSWPFRILSGIPFIFLSHLKNFHIIVLCTMPTTNFPHDSAYKAIFSHPEMVESLLLDFVPEEFVLHFDFATLEPCKSSFVTPDMRQRHNDIIWRVKWRGNWCYIYLLIEFQSGEDHWMALRICNYSTILWSDLVKHGQVNVRGKLPPVFPIVLYNGAAQWKAPLNTLDFVEPLHDKLKDYQPGQKYYVIDERHIPQEILAAAKGDAAYIIRVEQAENGQAIYDLAVDFIEGQPGNACLNFQDDVLNWMERRIEKVDPEWLNEKDEQKREGGHMFAEMVKEHVKIINAVKEGYRAEGRAEGLALGREEGRAECRAEGLDNQRATLSEMLEMRFGETAEHWLGKISEISDADSLKELTKALLTVETPEQFFRLLKKMRQLQ